MITLKRSLIAQSQKLATAYTRPQVRIVSCNFDDKYKIKQNTTMNVNKSQRIDKDCKDSPLQSSVKMIKAFVNMSFSYLSMPINTL